MLLSVIVLSLVRIEQPLHLEHADKYEHLLAYGCLMYWWGMVQPARRWLWMVALPLLGLGLEWAQTLVAYRSLEWNDALANLAGVMLAGVLLATRASRLLALADRKLFDRVNSRGS
jgi:VanZ family protein